MYIDHSTCNYWNDVLQEAQQSLNTDSNYVLWGGVLNLTEKQCRGESWRRNGTAYYTEISTNLLLCICDTPQALFWINEIMRRLARAVKLALVKLADLWPWSESTCSCMYRAPVKVLVSTNSLHWYFSVFLQYNICYGSSSEKPQWHTSNENPQCMFLWETKKNTVKTLSNEHTRLSKQCRLNQMPQSEASDQGIHCLPYIHQYFRDMNRW